MKDFETWGDLFDRVGESYMRPVQQGHCIWPVSIEDLYQGFKARLIDEIQEAAMQLGKDEVVILLQRVTDNGGVSRD